MVVCLARFCFARKPLFLQGVWLCCLLYAALHLPTYNTATAQPRTEPPNVDTLNRRATELLNNSPEQSLKLSLQSVQLALKTNYLSGHTKALVLAGQGYYRLNNYRKALRYFSMALDKAKVRRQDPEMGDAYALLGQAYYDFGDYEQSLAFAFNALGIREKIRDREGIATSLSQVGNVYFASGKLAKALAQYEKSLKIWRQLDNKGGLAACYAYIGQLYDKQRQYAKALEYLDKSLALHRQQKDARGVAQALKFMGTVHFHQGNHETALNYYFRALQREKRLFMFAAVAESHNNIAACYAATNQPHQAIFYHEKVVAASQKNPVREPLMRAYLGLAESHGTLKNFGAAYANHRLYTAVRDSIANDRTTVEIAEVEAKYQLENQRQALELLRKEKRINAITRRENRNLNYLVGVLSVALLLLSGVALSRYRIKQRSGRLLAARNQIIAKQNDNVQQANQKLLASETELRNLVATRDKFFTIIAHDLRGPLSSLTGTLGVMVRHIDRFSRDELKNFASDTNQEVHKLLDLLENLLHWSRTQRGSIRYEPQPLPLLETVEAIWQPLANMAALKSIVLKTGIPPGLGIVADRNMFAFTIRNLLFNAIKFTHTGGNIAVTAMRHGELVEITVSDTGIGIVPADLAKLFRIDTYHTTTGTANETGTGLGLVLCQEFVRRHGGALTVESEPGAGTTFRFPMPALVDVLAGQRFLA